MTWFDCITNEMGMILNTLGVGDGQGSLACYSSWGCRESDMTKWLNWTELNWTLFCSVQTPSHDTTDCSTPGFPVPNHLPQFVQLHVHFIVDAIQPSHLLLPSFLSIFNLSQHQALFQRVGSSHQVTEVLEFQLQYQSFQWIFRVYFL